MSAPPKQSEPIAVIGLGCLYPDADRPRRLWENVLARRRAFRRIPDCRMPLSAYYDSDKNAVDKTYSDRASLIDGFDFDWVRYRIPQQTVESTDIAHWIALDVALQAIADAGYNRETLPRERSRVVVGNSLTGEFTRAFTMGLRWPYVEKSLRAAAQARSLPPATTEELIETTKLFYKSSFPATNEDTLAGSLSNTIAGRICNYLDLKGGGYTVDGACSSSLLSIANAADALDRGEVDLCIAGGVDISLDPLELVGFSKVGALTEADMHVYDKRAQGFLPGEGAGFAVLKRLHDARRDGDYVYAVMRGWGMASDGAGGITAPTAYGQSLAILNAYRNAGYSPLELDFIEGHGTGTAVGDPIELRGIVRAMSEHGEPRPRQTGMTSMKSLIGHAKAAAGVAGFLKAVIAVNRRVIPPTAACDEPHDIFSNEARALYPVRSGRVMEPEASLKAGISAMGFGGINSHVTIESGDPPAQQLEPALPERAMLASSQQSELFVLSASSAVQLKRQVQKTQERAAGMSVAELADFSAQLAHEIDRGGAARVAIVADHPDKLLAGLDQALGALGAEDGLGPNVFSSRDRMVWVAARSERPRVGFLFPGQGSQQLDMARMLVERFDWAAELVDRADEWLKAGGNAPVSPLMYRELDRARNEDELNAWKHTLTDTRIAQPAISLASLLWWHYMRRLGVKPVSVAGHSLGELGALYAAGAYDDRRWIELAALRGKVMAEAESHGTMASIACDRSEVEALLSSVDGYVTIANLNSPQQSVISGDLEAVQSAVRQAKQRKLRASMLPVGGAFHSTHYEDAARKFGEHPLLNLEPTLDRTRFFSAMDGRPIEGSLRLGSYLARQMRGQVDFVATVRNMAETVDVVLEVGPGGVLSGLWRHTLDSDVPPALALESKARRDRDWNSAIGALFAFGQPLAIDALWARRFYRPFVPASERKFITNPCERPFNVDISQIQRSSISIPLSAEIQASVGSKMLPPATMQAELAAAQSVSPQTHEQVYASARNTAWSLPKPSTQAADSSRHSAAPVSVQAALIAALAKQTGFPAHTLSLDLRLIDDLHLDSIKSAELLGNVAHDLGYTGDFDPAKYSNAQLSEIIQALETKISESMQSESVDKTEVAEPEKQVPEQEHVERSSIVQSVVRSFVMRWHEASLPAAPPHGWTASRVCVIAGEHDNFAAELAQSLEHHGARVRHSTFSLLDASSVSDVDRIIILVDEPENCSDDRARVRTLTGMLSKLAATLPRELLDPDSQLSIAFVQRTSEQKIAGHFDWALDAFVATLHLERRALTFRALCVDKVRSAVAFSDDLLREFSENIRYEAALYDADGQRYVRRPETINPPDFAARGIDLHENDVVVVTAGARGITAECALALGEKSRATMILVGSSPHPNEDPNLESSQEIARTLQRFSDRGLRAEYKRCDMRDVWAVRELLTNVRGQHGKVRAIIHGAGLNKPRRSHEVSGDEAFDEIAPKLLGALHLFEALDQEPPELFVALTSVIGVVGMPNNAWYAFANQALDRSLGRFAAQHAQVKVLSLAYSVWDELGMGARMGSIAPLRSMGTHPIPVAEGVRCFMELIDHDPGEREIVVSARLGGLDTWRPEAPSKPKSDRFLEKIVRHEPGVAVVARAKLSLERDAYLRDHRYKDSYLFPTVFGLEAMAQAAAYVSGRSDFSNIVIEKVELTRPIVVNEERGLEIQMHARMLEKNGTGERVRVDISTEQSDFSREHFSAEFVLDGIQQSFADLGTFPAEALSVEPKRDLYGGVLFQGPMFQRVEKLYELSSKRCLFSAQYNAGDAKQWLLGDPYFRDAMLQSLQLCVVPDLCLPVRIERLVIRHVVSAGIGSRRARSSIEAKENNAYCCRVDVTTDQGIATESIQGYWAQILQTVSTWPTAETLATTLQDGSTPASATNGMSAIAQTKSDSGEYATEDLMRYGRQR